MECIMEFAKLIGELGTTVETRGEELSLGGIFTDEYCILPGLADVHVHLREPGFSKKETILTGTAAAAAGGYTDVCSMPNLDPVPHDLESLKLQLDIIKRDAKVRVHPYGAITFFQKGEKLAHMEAMAPYVCAFSDDGKGVQDSGLMLEAMQEAKRLGKMIVAHCEDESLLFGGYIHKGSYALEHGHRGICSESEWKQIERDLELVAKSGCSYHVCHVSAKESVQIIRQAKASGIDVTCETGPHYLVADQSMLKEEGCWKMNPPLRDKADKEALLEGICDGTVDMIATDHAPHTAEEKSRGLEKSNFGITGLECAFPLMYTALIKGGVMDMKKLLKLMAHAPRERFGLEKNAKDYTVFALGDFAVDAAKFESMGKSTFLDKWPVKARCMATYMDGAPVWTAGCVDNI
ncbi:MAG: dihydroorotase [Oscillospiraceae bacterium]|nr:dihydroorotase [Oscillospiraceae bacterium]